MLGSGFKAERLRVNLRLVINRLKLLEKKKSEYLRWQVGPRMPWGLRRLEKVFLKLGYFHRLSMEDLFALPCWTRALQPASVHKELEEKAGHSLASSTFWQVLECSLWGGSCGLSVLTAQRGTPWVLWEILPTCPDTVRSVVLVNSAGRL